MYDLVELTELSEGKMVDNKFFADLYDISTKTVGAFFKQLSVDYEFRIEHGRVVKKYNMNELKKAAKDYVNDYYKSPHN